MVSFVVNGVQRDVDIDGDTPLLWVLRDKLGLMGTKYGCGIAVCGVCTVLINDQPVRSCVTSVAMIAGKRVTTIEGISTDRSHPVQRAWLAEDVVQCGYCQSGQILSAIALLADNPSPSDTDIDTAMSGVLCRCGTYQRIRRAIHHAAELMSGQKVTG